VPYVGALLWIVGGRAMQPQEPRRRATDPGAGPGLLGALGRPGTHQARRIGDARSGYPGRGRGRNLRGGVAPSGWTVPPDDDPEFLRQLSERLKKDRPEN
jgi:hypothetical protein